MGKMSEVGLADSKEVRAGAYVETHSISESVLIPASILIEIVKESVDQYQQKCQRKR